MDDAYALPAEKVLAGLGVDANDGLTDERVIELRVKHGKNGNVDALSWRFVLVRLAD